jgi:hypothetical protein
MPRGTEGSGSRRVSLERSSVKGRIVQLYPQSVLVETVAGELQRWNLSRATKRPGTFFPGDRVSAKVSRNGDISEMMKLGNSPRFVRKLPLNERLIQRRPLDRVIRPPNLLGNIFVHRPPIPYDGMPITCERNAKGELVRATAIDRSGVQRQMLLERMWATLSDPEARLTYSENGAVKYVMHLSVSRDFVVTSVVSDDVRSLQCEMAVATQPLAIQVSGMVFRLVGGTIESTFQGKYENGQIDVDIDPNTYFPNAVARLTYFSPLIQETPSNDPDPLQDPNSQQTLKAGGPSKDWARVALKSILQMYMIVGCSQWQVWPWGTGLCGVVIVSKMISETVAESVYFTSLPNPPPPKPPPAPAPPGTILTPTPYQPAPFPAPVDCSNPCPFGQACLLGNCVDITGPPGDWDWGF